MANGKEVLVEGIQSGSMDLQHDSSRCTKMQHHGMPGRVIQHEALLEKKLLAPHARVHTSVT